MLCVLFLSALLGFTAAAPKPQLIDTQAVEAAPDPVLFTPPYDVSSEALTTGIASQSQGLKRDGDCAPQPAGSGPVATPDTPNAFRSNPDFPAMANNATTPDGYSLAMQNAAASLSASKYMGLTTLKSYDTFKCASLCNKALGCQAFNLYVERDPSLDPNKANCPNPPSLTNYKCTLWGAPVSAAEAKNKGQWRDSFQVVIAGSNAYNKATPPPAIGCFNGPVELGGAINAPKNAQGQNTYMGYKHHIFSQSQGFDPSLCAADCLAQTAYDRRHRAADGSYQSCVFFNAYALSLNGVPQGLYCSMYSQVWSPVYATNYGQYRGSDKYTVSRSYSYSLALSNGDENASCNSTAASSSSTRKSAPPKTASSPATRSSTTESPTTSLPTSTLRASSFAGSTSQTTSKWSQTTSSKGIPSPTLSPYSTATTSLGTMNLTSTASPTRTLSSSLSSIKSRSEISSATTTSSSSDVLMISSTTSTTATPITSGISSSNSINTTTTVCSTSNSSKITSTPNSLTTTAESSSITTLSTSSTSTASSTYDTTMTSSTSTISSTPMISSTSTTSTTSSILSTATTCSTSSTLKTFSTTSSNTHVASTPTACFCLQNPSTGQFASISKGGNGLAFSATTRKNNPSLFTLDASSHLTSTTLGLVAVLNLPNFGNSGPDPSIPGRISGTTLAKSSQNPNYAPMTCDVSTGYLACKATASIKGSKKKAATTLIYKHIYTFSQDTRYGNGLDEVLFGTTVAEGAVPIKVLPDSVCRAKDS